ncbi:hypothetical protein Scep_026491 [Stephania cephalantha]|uniref:Uncharacterized protein n=1 Tax=Stephania cephalantha TaxID=152367 RepID=A0AAP0HS39_9MAGN
MLIGRYKIGLREMSSLGILRWTRVINRRPRTQWTWTQGLITGYWSALCQVLCENQTKWESSKIFDDRIRRPVDVVAAWKALPPGEGNRASALKVADEVNANPSITNLGCYNFSQLGEMSSPNFRSRGSIGASNLSLCEHVSHLDIIILWSFEHLTTLVPIIWDVALHSDIGACRRGDHD